MTDRRDAFLTKISEERTRNLDMPGSERDSGKRPNDWVTCALFYLSQAGDRRGESVRRVDFEDGLIKAAAVILAALEHADLMAENKRLK